MNTPTPTQLSFPEELHALLRLHSNLGKIDDPSDSFGQLYNFTRGSFGDWLVQHGIPKYRPVPGKACVTDSPSGSVCSRLVDALDAEANILGIPGPTATRAAKEKDAVNHPSHYGGEDNVYEAVKVIEAWEKQNPNLTWNLLTAVKYLCRCGLKDSLLQDLKKTAWYVKREIDRLETGEEHPVNELCKEVIEHGAPRGFFEREQDGMNFKFTKVDADYLKDLPPVVNPDYRPVPRRDPDSDSHQGNFVRLFRYLASKAHANAREKGFWDNRDSIVEAAAFFSGLRAQAAQDAVDMQALMLISSELGEAGEGIRKGHPPDEHLPQFTSTEVELADAVIRIMEYSYGRKWRVAEALVAKMEYNLGRAPMHGKPC